jgi:PHS family inorganic phosphate transporter-like MFS transporter
MSFENGQKTIQVEESTNYDQLALDALERRRQALEEVSLKCH